MSLCIPPAGKACTFRTVANGGPDQAHFVGALFPSSGEAAASENLPAPFAADVRVACLQSQTTPLLSIHDLDCSLKQPGGYAKVQ